MNCHLCRREFEPESSRQKYCDVCRKLDGEAFEAINRYAKARALAEALWSAGVGPEDAICLDDVGWKLVAKLAGSNVPSGDRTKALAVYLSARLL